MSKPMSELAIRYRKFSGLIQINIDEMIANTPREKLPNLYARLVWNIQRGRRINPNSYLGKEFAWIVVELSIRCHIDLSLADVIPDNVVGWFDKLTHHDLDWAKKIIDNVDNPEVIIAYLLGDGDDIHYILEEGDGRIIIEN